MLVNIFELFPAPELFPHKHGGFAGVLRAFSSAASASPGQVVAAASLAAAGQSRIRAIMALCWFNHDEASDCHQPEWFVMPQFKWIQSPSRQLGSASHGDIG
jgi:hypothetical protein